MDRELVMFVLQGGLAVIMLFFGFILNGMRTGIERVNVDLKGLNDAVLGEYMTRKDAEDKWAVHRQETESKWSAQRVLDHELRTLITTVMVDAARASGKPYDHGGDES